MSTKSSRKNLALLNQQLEKDLIAGVVGFALFDTERRSFIALNETERQEPIYSSDAEYAEEFANRIETYQAMLDLRLDTKITHIIPLVYNDYFGLSPLPGALDGRTDKFGFFNINDDAQS